MPDHANGPHVQIEPWTGADLDLLRRVNTPEMKKHLGGPETDEQVLIRHQRYLNFVPEGKWTAPAKLEALACRMRSTYQVF